MLHLSGGKNLLSLLWNIAQNAVFFIWLGIKAVEGIIHGILKPSLICNFFIMFTGFVIEDDIFRTMYYLNTRKKYNDRPSAYCLKKGKPNILLTMWQYDSNREAKEITQILYNNKHDWRFSRREKKPLNLFSGTSTDQIHQINNAETGS